ncbi:hypothetical protein ScPMuIL_002659 [Solemya velum]
MIQRHGLNEKNSSVRSDPCNSDSISTQHEEDRFIDMGITIKKKTYRLSMNWFDYKEVFCSSGIPKEFNPNFKNPCWCEHDGGNKTRLRCLPYFSVIGVAKSGTSDLYSALTSQSLIMSGRGKEAHWLTMGFFRKGKPFKWYLDYYQGSADKIAEYTFEHQDRMKGPVIGDFTPGTFFRWGFAADYISKHDGTLLFKNIPELVYNINRNTKLIVIMRDPVTRLSSDFNHFYGKVFTPQVFHNSVTRSIMLWQECVSNRPELECATSTERWMKVSLTRINAGLYHIYLKEWFKVFPRKQFHIVKFEDYSRNRTHVVKSILDFLDVRTDIAGGEKDYNETPIQNKKRYPDMMPKTRELLQHFYRPHNEQLVALLNDNNFNWNSDYASQSVV